MPPLGLNSIGNVLEENGFTVKLFDLELYSADLDLFSYIKDLSPKIIGISGTSHSRFESFKIANIAKNISKKIITVYGGCHATFTAEDTLSHIKEIDYIIRGEGEATFLDLANFFLKGQNEIEKIKGISFRKNGKVVNNEARERIINLDSIPYSRHLLEMDKYNTKLEYLNIPATSIITSRGCPYNCSFCSASAMFGATYTMRSAKHVVDEIEYCVEKFKIKGVKFFDSTLTLNRQHILSLIAELNARRINLPWECEIRVNTVDRNLLAAMKEAGCYYVNFGIESVNDRILSIMNKGINLAQAVAVLRWCRELGLKTMVFFSFGHIGETWADSRENFAFINKYIDHITHLSVILGMKIYPGTYLEKYAKENGTLAKDFPWSKPIKEINEGPINTDRVPLLLQPSYGLKELKRCYYGLYKTELKRDLKRLRNIFSKLNNNNSFSDYLRKISRIFRLLISEMTF